MRIRKKLTIVVVLFVMVISLFPVIGVKAADNINIISKSKITADQAKNWAKSRGATDTFANLADLYFKYYFDHGNVNPAIAYVQSAKETNFGKFGGVLDETYHNPCGLKIAAGGSDTDKNAHKKFDSWDEGVQAHLDHMALYAGADGYPRDNTYDERQFRTIKGTAPTVESLGGKWAPSATYGDEVNKLYQELVLFSGGSNQDANNVTDRGIGWQKENGKWYYIYSNGTIATGWLKSGDIWYFLKNGGDMSAACWITAKGSSYYLDSTGKMVTNTTIDGFKIGSDGKRKGGNNKVIAIDAGHDYGSDGGAVYTINGVTYKEVDLDIQVAAKLKNELEKRGYTVVMTRQEGETPSYGSLSTSLSHRVDEANNANAELFISIHHNAVDGIPTANGIETYYSVHAKDSAYGGDLDSDKIEKSKKIAQAINDKICNKIDANNRGSKSDASAAVGSLFVLRNTKMPGVLVEVGFITNSEEAARCADPNAQQQVAEAIAEAVSENSDIYTTIHEERSESTHTTENSNKAGWNQLTDGSWNYYNQSGTKVVNDWVNISDNWFYLNGNGTMTNGWQNIGGKWYYLNPVSDGSKGAMKTGWQCIDGKWYYLNPISDGSKGAMKTGWQYIDGRWYYLNPTSDGSKGAMKTGWQYVEGKWYYLNPISDGSKGAIKIGWQYIDGKWYYLNPVSGGPLGAMLVNTTVNVYVLGSDGAMIE